MSPSTRRAWIEIRHECTGSCLVQVALHPEGVDRNGYDIANLDRGWMSPSTRRAWIEIAGAIPSVPALTVALHPEGVDRNTMMIPSIGRVIVALHPEGVDRNITTGAGVVHLCVSPSTRRAWIETASAALLAIYSSVALHPEGVDRNTLRAYRPLQTSCVALHPEGVDRNLGVFLEHHAEGRRPPPGGRG